MRKLIIIAMLAIALIAGSVGGYTMGTPPQNVTVAQMKVWGQMNAYTTPTLYDTYQRMKANGQTELTMFIMSPGGLIVDCFGVIDLMREMQNNGITITTVAYGMVASAAVPVFLAGDIRIAGPNVTFMVHDPYTDATIEDESTKKAIEMDKDRYIKFVESRSNLSYEELEKMLQKTTFFSATEALSYGMVDIII